MKWIVDKKFIKKNRQDKKKILGIRENIIFLAIC